MRSRPRTALKMKRKTRQCPKCGARINNQRKRCKRCSKVLHMP